MQILLIPLGHLRHHVVQDLQLPPREEQVQRLADADHHHQHQREQDGGGREGLNQPQADQTGKLDYGEHVHPLDGHLELKIKFVLYH